MKKLLKNKRFWLIVSVILVLVVVGGCARVTNKDGTVMAEKIIKITTTFQEMMESGGWFQAIFVWPLAQAINHATPYVTVLGAVALVTVGINLLTFSFTVKSTVSSQKMQFIQPEIQKIQEKYRDRKDQNAQMAMAKEMQDIYAKHNINPFGSLLTTFMQFPIIIAMWQAAQRAEAVVNAEILGVKLINSPMSGLRNILADAQQGFANNQHLLVIIFMLMALAQFASMKLPQILAKKRKAKAPRRPDDQTPDTQGTMMIMMLGLILYLAINWPTAMSLYWMITSIVTIFKTYFIQWRYIDNAKV